MMKQPISYVPQVSLRVATCTSHIRQNYETLKTECTSCFFRYLVSLCLAVICFSVHITPVHALVPCNNTDDCQRKYMDGSECIVETGFCSNSFYKHGCLSKLQQQKNASGVALQPKIRVCSSSDPPEAEILGYCISAKSPFNYTEIRLLGNNWESVFFETWIAQILLSEMLGVPTSVDTGHANLAIDFYDEHDRFDYGKGYDWEGLRLASEVGDCRLFQQSSNESEYKSCGHVSLEVWEGQFSAGIGLKQDNVIEQPSALGVLGNGGWYIPWFTGRRDPTLVTYLGLEGEENRQKLAKTFKRPTTWIDYCNEVSETNCTVPDDVAVRPPSDESEKSRYFASGIYTGFFRSTEENDCDLWPKNCTGHFVDYPCGWSSTFEQQVHHLDIALSSSGPEPYCKGYPYSNMVEIWNAANATRSDVMMLYWAPDTLVQTYFGTDAEFLKVALPSPTQTCFENRIKATERCDPETKDRVGNPEGACDDQPHALLKFITSNFYTLANDPSISKVLHSPAYHAIQNFQVTGLQLTELFDSWIKTTQSSETEKILGPREAVCHWVVENYDLLQTFVPRSYPRTVVDGDDAASDPMFYVALIIATLALLLILAVSVAVYRARKRRAMLVAQVEFLLLLLCGLIVVQIGSLSLALPPSNVSCVLAAWAINLGYTLELVPLIVKVAAINALLAAARQMKRTKVQRSSLFLRVAIITSLMAVYLTIWTAMDPPNKTEDYELTETVNDDGETQVVQYSFCSSDVMYWSLSALLWRSILLLLATVLAFQTRKSPINFNESKTLAVMIYSQFSFLIWSLVLFFVQSKLGETQTARYQSLVQSLDVTMVLCIYIIPKLLTSDETFQDFQRSSVENKLRSSVMHGMSQQARFGAGSDFDQSGHLSSDAGKWGIDSTCEPRTTLIPMTDEIAMLFADVEKSQKEDVDQVLESHPSIHNETTKTDKVPVPSAQQEENPANTNGLSPKISQFNLLADHVMFTVQYLNHVGNDEIIQVKCYNDETKIEYYREETEKFLQQNEGYEPDQDTFNKTSNEESKTSSHLRSVSTALDTLVRDADDGTRGL